MLLSNKAIKIIQYFEKSFADVLSVEKEKQLV